MPIKEKVCLSLALSSVIIDSQCLWRDYALRGSLNSSFCVFSLIYMLRDLDLVPSCDPSES